MQRTRLIQLASLAALLFLGGASMLSCRSAYGVDPVKDPAAASRLPGYWKLELGGSFGSAGTEKYLLQYDGEKAWILGLRPDSSMGGDGSIGHEITKAEYEAFVVSALALDPFNWNDRKVSGQAAFETLRGQILAGDRGRSFVIESPDATERLLFERLRMLAANAAAASSAR